MQLIVSNKYNIMYKCINDLIVPVNDDNVNAIEKSEINPNGIKHDLAFLAYLHNNI